MRVYGNKDKSHPEGKGGALVQYESMREFDNQLLWENHIDGRDNASNSGDSSFCGTETFDEADELRKYGDRGSLEMMMKAKAVTDKAFEKLQGTRAKNFNDVLGFQPIVPNAIIGLPQSMINQKRQPKKIRTIDVFVNASTVWYTSTEDIALRGAYTLSAIDALERSGYRVNLYIGKCSIGSGNRVIGFFMNIKQSDQPLNLMKVAYYIVNPSFLRRTGFRIMETEGNLPDVTSGYGSTCDHDKQRKFFREKINAPQMVIIDSETDINTNQSDEDNLAEIQRAFAGYLDEK